MKTLYVSALTFLIVGCTSHSVRCHGALQPINIPVTATDGTDRQAQALPEKLP
jgi:hypothetical protein